MLGRTGVFPMDRGSRCSDYKCNRGVLAGLCVLVYSFVPTVDLTGF